MLDIQVKETEEKRHDYKHAFLPPLKLPLGSDAYEKTMREMLGTAKYRLRVSPAEADNEDEGTISSTSSATKTILKSSTDESLKDEPVEPEKTKLKHKGEKNVRFAGDEGVTGKTRGKRWKEHSLGEKTTGEYERCSECSRKQITRKLPQVYNSSYSYQIYRNVNSRKRVPGEKSIGETTEYFKKKSSINMPDLVKAQKRAFTQSKNENYSFRLKENTSKYYTANRTNVSSTKTPDHKNVLQSPSWLSNERKKLESIDKKKYSPNFYEGETEDSINIDKMFPSMFNASKLYAKYLGGNYLPPIKSTPFILQMYE